MNALFSFYSSKEPITYFVSNFDKKIQTAQELTEMVDWLVANFNLPTSEYSTNFFTKFFLNSTIAGTILPFWQADYQLENLQSTLIFVIDKANETLKLAYLPSAEIWFLESHLLLNEGDYIDIRTLFANLETPENALISYFDKASKALSEDDVEKLYQEFDKIADKLAVYDASNELSKEALMHLDQAYSNTLLEIVQDDPNFEKLSPLELEYLFLYPDDTRDEQLTLLTDDFQELLAKTSEVNKRILKNYKILHNYLSTFGKYYKYVLNDEKFTELLEKDYDPETDNIYDLIEYQTF